MIWIEELIKAVQKSSSEIKKYFGNSKSLNMIGAGGDEIEEIDKMVEDTIINSLKENINNFNLVSEEVGEMEFGSGSKDFIVLDPIDGSTNAARGIPFFCVSIAHFTSDNMTSLQNAVIYNWITGDIYRATKDKGASKNENKIECSTIKDLEKAIIAHDLDPERFEHGIKTVTVLKNVYKFRHMGSAALDLALVAEGCIELYIDLRNKLRLVDVAAGILLVQEAGGFVFNEKGEDINVPIKVDSRVSICATNKFLEKEIKSSIKKI